MILYWLHIGEIYLCTAKYKPYQCSGSMVVGTSREQPATTQPYRPALKGNIDVANQY